MTNEAQTETEYRRPGIYLDQEHAEMMVYALESHLKAIGEDLAKLFHVPYELHGEKLTVHQRLQLLYMGLTNCLPTDGEDFASIAWTALPIPIDESEEDGPDPEELAEMLHEEHEKVARARVAENIARHKRISDPAGGPDYFPDEPRRCGASICMTTGKCVHK